jgi:hypothetical protein
MSGKQFSGVALHRTLAGRALRRHRRIHFRVGEAERWSQIITLREPRLGR